MRCRILPLLLLAALPAVAQPVRLENGIFRVTADRNILTYDRPFDIAPGTSITFRRRDAATFSVMSGPLVYEEDVGPLFHDFRSSDGAGWHFRPFRLGFDFPFFDLSLREIFLAAEHAIYGAAPREPQSSWLQYGLLDVYGLRTPLIAPLLHPPRGGQLPSRVYVRELVDRAVFTFRSGPAFLGEYDVQAVLKNDGTIVFSYKTLDRIDWGVVAVSSGREPSRTSRTLIASGTDPEGDVSGEASNELRNLADIVGYDVFRVADSDLLEFRIRVKHSFSGPAPFPMLFGLSTTPESVLDESAFRNMELLDIRFEPEGAVIPLMQYAAGGPVSVGLNIFVGAGAASDEASGNFVLEPGAKRLETDLSAFATPAEVSGPIIQAFMRPLLNERAVGQLISGTYALDEREVDQFAVYSTFQSEMTFGAAGSSSGGNPAVSGIAQWQSAAQRFTPSVMNLNEPLKSPNNTLGGALFILSHEFGHRWLDYTLIDESGTATNVLNPDGAHAAAYVHNPAAFKVASSFDTSAMGGGWFEDLGAGQFQVPIYSSAGYSWWELYLMGLASPDEVPPWFYVANVQPPVTGLAPGGGQRYSGMRKDVRVEQIISALGPRVPSFEQSQRTFRTLFAIVERADAPATSQQLAAVALYASEFPRRFSAMTGQRGRIATRLPERPSAAFNATVNGTLVNFTDTSDGDPVYWNWTFGDGGISTLPNPTHQYARAGNYEVTMTVRNSRGISSKTMSIAVTDSASPRRRGVRR